jgi:hypothetical protein
VPKLKSGKDGKPRVVYADVADAERWMWRFVDGARTAGELFWGLRAGTGRPALAV